MNVLSLLTLFSSLLYSMEQPVPKESGGGSHTAGNSLNLKCETSDFQFKTSKLGWYLWAPGHIPLGLTNFDSISTDATEDRIITSREDSGSRIFLQIKDLGLRDSGQYHCVRRVGTGDDRDKLFFGLGTDVTVEPGTRTPLTPNVFLVRSQDVVACLIRNFYPKEIHVSLASPGALISAQTYVMAPMANGIYSAVQIGRIGENDTVTCTVEHLGKEIHVSHKPEGNEQRNKLLLSVLGLRLLFMRIMIINIFFTAMALIF
ncbi:immunoglobulin alpha-2 heavy chain isoform X2 [Sarcophilus harrisii]|uniref:immunoglobulin alpha-2 heavy chain isoform X2 n=1 Tax=Sarcophilus harrisii TaxID=9305 RepID=UPI00062BE4CF|nr:immunoglobulin alpha-2 heavy chain isoform X2 [Sarcophilus harrisii]